MAKQPVMHAGPAELLAAQQAATKDAVAETLGTSIDANGDLVTPPQVSAFYARYQQLEATVSTLQETVVQYGSTITAQAAHIDQLSGLLHNKASADTVNRISQRVTTTEATLTQKADTSAVNQQFQAVAGLDTDQASAIAAAVQAIKSEDGLVQGILTKQANYDILLPALRADVDLKAPAATVSALTGQVTAVRNAVNDSATGLAATKALVDSTKAGADSLALKINDTATGLLATKAIADAATTEVGKRLLRAGDTATGQLGVPVASTMTSAVQKSELVGGIQRPYRIFLNVGAAQAGAYVRNGQNATMTDSLGLGQTYILMSVRVKFTTQPTATTTTIKLYSNGSEIYSAAVPLTSLPAVGKLLDLASFTNTATPLEIPLPSLLTMSISSGAGNGYTDGINQ